MTLLIITLYIAALWISGVGAVVQSQLFQDVLENPDWRKDLPHLGRASGWYVDKFMSCLIALRRGHHGLHLILAGMGLATWASVLGVWFL